MSPSVVLFWSAVGLLAYTYAIFPLLVFLRALLWARPHGARAIEPRVSLIIAAHNEVAGIAAKLDNILALDYPCDRLEVIIASDGSDDGTDAIVRGYEARGVRLLALPRQGKAAALNAAVAVASGEVLVFSDANSMFAADALRALVRPLADPSVGGVAGNQCYRRRMGPALSGDGEQAYWSLDRALKQWQSAAGHVISATGAIYGIRRALFREVPAGVTDDFVTSTGVIEQGYRLVFTPDAVAYEPVAESSEIEFGRKVRVITRGLRGVIVRRALLNPIRYGFYAVVLLSHKVLRRLMILPLLLLVLVAPFVWSAGPLYRGADLAQGLFYGAAALGLVLSGTRLGRSRVLTIPFFFAMVNAACLLALVNMARGQQIRLWEPRRAAPSEPSPSAGRAGYLERASS